MKKQRSFETKELVQASFHVSIDSLLEDLALTIKEENGLESKYGQIKTLVKMARYLLVIVLNCQ